MRNSKHLRRRAGFFILLAMLGLAAAGTASAAPSGTAPSLREGRAALQALCPRASEQIQAALGGAVWRHQLDSRLHASFVLEGERISAVQVSGGPQVYAVRLQRVLAELQCQADVPAELRFDVATLTR